MSSSDEAYSSDEVEEVLRRALHRKRVDTLTHAELLALGSEVGIDPAAMQEAAREVALAREQKVHAQALQASRWRGFRAHFTAYLIVNAALLGMGVVLGLARLSLLPLLGWGIGLAFHLAAVVRAPGKEDVDEYAREQREQAQRAERKEQRSARRKEPRPPRRTEDKQAKQERALAQKKLEQAMSKGVTVLLEKAAEGLENAAARLQETEPGEAAAQGEKPADGTDFGAFVASKKGGASAKTRAPRDARSGVRVELGAEPAKPEDEELAAAAREGQRARKSRQ